MDQILLKQLETWHETGDYQKIIERLENYPEHNYDTIGHLARAYNNRGACGDFDKAVELLKMVEDFGRQDPLWYYRLGYAYYSMGNYLEAVRNFEIAAELDPEDEDSQALLLYCTEQLMGELADDLQEENIEVYSEEEMDLISDYIADTFGEFESVFHEIVSPDIHVDICLIPPTEEQNYYTLVTMGMGAHRMNTPSELDDYHLQQAELLLCLPPDWNLHSDEEKWYWPVRLLKILARLPLQEDTWLGWGHTVDNGEAFDESTQLCGSMLISPVGFGDEESVCQLPDGQVNFYQIIPLYREEMEYKMEHGAESLLDQLDSSVLIINPKRTKFCAEGMLS